MSGLAADYLAGRPELTACFGGVHPREVLDHGVAPAPWHPELVAGIRRFQSEIGGAGRIDGDEGVFITGQQPGLFGGPLYTVYKALTALQLAAAAQEKTGGNFVPIYWVGGDDHDFAEIAELHILGKNHADFDLSLTPTPGQQAASIFRLPVPAALHDIAEQMAIAAPGSEHTAEVLQFLHESLDASANLSEWHARLMARLFRDTPLLIFSPDLPEARQLAVPVFETEIRNPLESTRRLNEGGAALEALGYGAQVVKDSAACNFFLERQGVRCRVRHDGDTFVVVETGERFSESALLEMLHRERALFTANVALRCIVQQHLFPARAYVAGPGELAYWAQMKGVFEHFNAPMPCVYPRLRAVLTSLKANKLLGKLGLALDDLYLPPGELEERALRGGAPAPGQAVLEQHRAALEGLLESLQADLKRTPALTREAPALAVRYADQVRQDLGHFERSLLRADEARLATVRTQLSRLCNELAPARQPQERHYTIFSWLFAYGFDLIPRLNAALDYRSAALQEVEL